MSEEAETEIEQKLDIKSSWSYIYSARIMVLCGIILLAGIFMNGPKENGLFRMGVNFIYQYQSSTSRQPAAYAIWNIFTTLGQTWFVGAILGILFIFYPKKLKICVFIAYFLAASYVMIFLKKLYLAPRPCWVSSKITMYDWKCQSDFGCPSGHSFAAILFYEPILADFIGIRNPKIQWPLAGLFAFMLIFSRIVLGAHSFDQVIWGFLLGLGFLVMYRYRVMYLIYHQFWDLAIFKNFKTLSILISLHITAVIIPLLLSLVNQSINKMSQGYIDNLNNICSSFYTLNGLVDSITMGMVIINTTFGLGYGLFALPNSSDNCAILLGNKMHFYSKFKANTDIEIN